jgi:biofilm protein TabA
MILDKLENWKIYARLDPGLARGLAWLAGADLAGLGEGRHELDGDRLYANVQVYAPKPPAECRWEAHRRYLDIQYLASGCEGMACAPWEKLKLLTPYDDAKDVEFFEPGPENSTCLAVTAPWFAVFFPQEAHRPGSSLAAPGPAGRVAPETVKKIVVKVQVL